LWTMFLVEEQWLTMSILVPEETVQDSETLISVETLVLRFQDSYVWV